MYFYKITVILRECDKSKAPLRAAIQSRIETAILAGRPREGRNHRMPPLT